jgi:hypothetical protein
MRGNTFTGTLLVATALLSVFPVRTSAVDICISEKLKVSAVYGRVIILWDVGPQTPIPGATVELRQEVGDEWQTVAQTTTDDVGRFEIKEVRAGKYEILVKSERFRGWGTRLQVVKGSKSRTPEKEIVVALTPFIGGGHCSEGKVDRIKSK